MLLGPGLQLQDLLGKLWGHTLRVLLSLIHAVCDIMAWARCSIAQGSIRMSVPVNHFVGHRLPDHGFTLSRPRRLGAKGARGDAAGEPPRTHRLAEGTLCSLCPRDEPPMHEGGTREGEDHERALRALRADGLTSAYSRTPPAPHPPLGARSCVFSAPPSTPVLAN